MPIRLFNNCYFYKKPEVEAAAEHFKKTSDLQQQLEKLREIGLNKENKK